MPRAPRSKRFKSETLRELPRSDRLFWKTDLSEQLAQKARDKHTDNTPRNLLRHEIETMALHEVAVFRGRGFFQYLPSREALKKPKTELLLPKERSIKQPG